MLDLFATTVLPVLPHGCEVWGNENNSLVDTVSFKFCEYLLG